VKITEELLKELGARLETSEWLGSRWCLGVGELELRFYPPKAPNHRWAAPPPQSADDLHDAETLQDVLLAAHRLGAGWERQMLARKLYKALGVEEG
jgi:hypothetical protein